MCICFIIFYVQTIYYGVFQWFRILIGKSSFPSLAELRELCLIIGKTLSNNDWMNCFKGEKEMRHKQINKNIPLNVFREPNETKIWMMQIHRLECMPLNVINFFDYHGAAIMTTSTHPNVHRYIEICVECVHALSILMYCTSINAKTVAVW